MRCRRGRGPLREDESHRERSEMRMSEWPNLGSSAECGGRSRLWVLRRTARRDLVRGQSCFALLEAGDVVVVVASWLSVVPVSQIASDVS